MEILIKILYTIFFLVLNYFLHIWFNRDTQVKYRYLYTLILLATGLFFLSIFFEREQFDKLFLVLLVFSSSIMIFKYLRKVTDLSNSATILEDPLLQKRYDKFKDFIFVKLYVPLLIIYQLLLIWCPSILNGLLERS